MRCADSVADCVRHGSDRNGWFEIALVVLTLFTGIVWLLDKLFFAKRRAANAGLLGRRSEPHASSTMRSAFFPVLPVVLCLRASSPSRSGSRPAR